MATGKPGPAFAAIGTHRVARAGRFQPEHTGRRSRYADRTAAVAGMCEGKKARRNCRGRAARGSARGARQIPRIPSRTEQARLCGGQQSEFLTGPLSEDLYPGIEEAA